MILLKWDVALIFFLAGFPSDGIETTSLVYFVFGIENLIGKQVNNRFHEGESRRTAI
jgi:hypothetical protein